jgi:hypothetical protein
MNFDDLGDAELFSFFDVDNDDLFCDIDEYLSSDYNPNQYNNTNINISSGR